MRKNSSETCALLNGHSDCDDYCKSDTVLAAGLTHGCAGNVLKRKSCFPRLRLCPFSLVVLLSVLQVLSIGFYTGMYLKVEELQLQLTALHEKAECNGIEQKGREDIIKVEDAHASKTENEQRLMTVESNIARVNQYVVSLKSSYEKLKSEVEQGATLAQLSSLSEIIQHINRTASTDVLSMRAEVNQLQCAIANLTSTISVMEENISSNMQGLDRAFSHIQMLTAEMGLVHSYPNSTDLKTTPVPVARPHPKENNASNSILLMNMRSQSSTKDNYRNNSMEGTLRGASSAEQQAKMAGEVHMREQDQNDENLHPMPNRTDAAGFNESGSN